MRNFHIRMGKAQQAAFVLKKEYDDFDRFVGEVRAWALDFKQLDRGAFFGGLTQVVLPGFQLGRARFKRRLHQVGRPPLALKTFVVPMNPEMQLFWRGKHLSGNDLMAFPEGGDLDCVSESDFDVCTVSLPVSLLTEVAGRMGGLRAEAALLKPEACRCDLKALQGLRRRLTQLEQSLANVRATSRDLSSLSHGLATWIVEVWLAGANDGWKRTARSRARIVSRALDEIEMASPDPVTVSELCMLTNSSKRTLEYAFLERFGVSPKRYLLTRQLNCVRRSLREADPRRTKVADIANYWGFWHMGQFAADYHWQFSELPSKTLQVT